MSLKRKAELEETRDAVRTEYEFKKKHTLDSDEEDSDEYEKEDLNNSDIEGEEEGVEGVQDEVKITPFNMREELEEGHFDKEGYYHWNKDSDIKDNWLDNVDWMKVKTDKDYFKKNADGDSNDSTNILAVGDEAKAYAEILGFMKPNETVEKTLRRLGKSRVKISSSERLRRKKLGIIDESGEEIIKLTELVNGLLTKTGNMDIYQETYEEIANKCGNLPTTSQKAQLSSSGGCDMYADDFLDKEKNLIDSEKQKPQVTQPKKAELQWEFKWKQDDTEIQGPFSTEQMQKWVLEDYFKKGVYVRKCGESENFYTSNRIDFELYM